MKVFYESGPGYVLETEVAGCLRAEGENRPSRPTHVILHCDEDIVSLDDDIEDDNDASS